MGCGKPALDISCCAEARLSLTENQNDHAGERFMPFVVAPELP